MVPAEVNGEVVEVPGAMSISTRYNWLFNWEKGMGKACGAGRVKERVWRVAKSKSSARNTFLCI